LAVSGPVGSRRGIGGHCSWQSFVVVSILSFVEGVGFGFGCVVFLAFMFAMMLLFSSWQCKTFMFFGGFEKAIAD